MRNNFKIKNILKYFMVAIAFVLVCNIFSLGANCFTATAQSVNTKAIFTEETVADECFSMAISVNPRRRNFSLEKVVKTIEDTAGENLSYYCFNWRDVDYLKFKINSKNLSEKRVVGLKLVVTNLQSTYLESSVGVNESAVLYETVVKNNIFAPFEFYYYIDSDSEITEGVNRSKGNDFGLYKFDCIYTYLEEDSSNPTQVSLGDICVAIIPDKIDTIDASRTKILYDIKSSNKLMNVFKLYLSNDAYKYVNPKHLQWVVVGTDKENVNYILTKKQKEDDLDKYGNYRYIWDSLESTSGQTFVFDSNDVEGTWTVYLQIINDDDEIIKTLTASDLSTIKVTKSSDIWWIIILIVSIFVLAGIVTLIIVKKKKDKVW